MSSSPCCPRSALRRHTGKSTPGVYRPRDPRASPFYRLVRDHFDEFHKVYPERYEKRFGFWRPVIREAIEKFLECGDMRYGFARVLCPNCGARFAVAFSCKQRGACASCGQKRALILAHRLINDVLAPVPHRQYVFTIPKRLRVYFRYSRDLIGGLCRAAYETVKEVTELELRLEVDGEDCVPAMIAAPQSFGNLLTWNIHVHALVPEGAFRQGGEFVSIPHIRLDRAIEIWEDKVFDLLWEAGRIDHETIGSMKAWKHSGFSIHNAVRLEAEDHAGLQRLIEYIARSPFSLARFVKVTPDGRVFYRAGRAECIRFPALGQEEELAAGMRRNYEVFDPLDFLAAVVQHIPNKGEHTLRYYGYYSNKSRGMRARRGESNNAAKQDEPLTPFELKQRLTWAALIKCVYEVDPLECPKCHSPMNIVGFVERDQKSCIREILTAAGMWQDAPTRGPPAAEPAPALEVAEPSLDYDFFENCPD